MLATHDIERIIRRLETRSKLEESDREALHALPLVERTLDSGSYLVREGEAPEACILLLSGFAFRHKVTGLGQRQIVSIHLAGEFLDLQNSFLGVSDHNVQALTRVRVAFLPILPLQQLARDYPRVARAMWIDTLIDSAIFREWLVNVGRRDSVSRVAHLLCEFAVRLRRAGLAGNGEYELPMTQEQLADCTGITPVHANRV